VIDVVTAEITKEKHDIYHRATGNGAPNIMRMPGRLHITWQDDQTLKIDADSGKQTRMFHFGATSGLWTTDMFVEAIYTSLKNPPKRASRN
jgi:hypothetical protein